MAVESDDLFNLSDEQLIQFADENLGIVIQPGTKRSAIMTKLVNAAFALSEE